MISSSLRLFAVVFLGGLSSWGQGEVAPADASGIDSDVRSVLTAEVRGNAAEAIERLRKEVASTGDATPPKTLARLVALLQQTGRLDEAKTQAARLSNAAEPYASWSRTRIAQLDAGLRRQSTGDDDPLLRLILQLDDSEHSRWSSARNELLSVGALASPSIRKHIRRLSPPGARRAMELLGRSPDEELPAFIESLLTLTGDQAYLGLVGAEHIIDLPVEARLKLGRLASENRSEMIRLSGLRALATLPGQRPGVLDAVRAIVDSPTSSAPVEAIRILGADGMRDIPAVNELLLRWSTSDRPEVASAAVYQWAAPIDPADETRALSALAAVKVPAARSTLIRMSIDQQRRWPGVLAIGAMSDDTDLRNRCVSALVATKAALPGPTLAKIINARRVADGASFDLLPLMRNCMEPGAEDAAETFAREQQGALHDCFEYLVRVAPERARRLASLVVGQERTLDQQKTAEFFRDHGDASCVPTFLDWLGRSANVAPQFVPEAIVLDVIAKHSDASCLPAFIALAGRNGVRFTPQVIERTGAALQRWLEPAMVPDLIKGLDPARTELAVRYFTVAAEVATPAQADALLSVAETYTNAELGRQLVDLIARLGGPTGDARLARLFTHRVAAIRVEALSLAVKHASPEAHRAMVQAISTGPAADAEALSECPEVAQDPEFRSAVLARMLAGDIGGTAVVHFFEAIPQVAIEATSKAVFAAQAKGSSGGVPSGVLTAALASLARLKSPAAVEPAVPFLSHADSNVRIAAVNAIVSSYSLEAGNHLLDAMKDHEPEVRTAAANALKRLTEYLEQKKHWESWLAEHGADSRPARCQRLQSLLAKLRLSGARPPERLGAL